MKNPTVDRLFRAASRWAGASVLLAALTAAPLGLAQNGKANGKKTDDPPPPPPPPAPAFVATYSGQAQVSAMTYGPDSPEYTSLDTGELPAAGGDLTFTGTNVRVGSDDEYILFGAVTVSTRGANNTTTSRATLNNMQFFITTAQDGPLVFEASLIDVTASAHVDPDTGAVSVSKNVVIEGLKLNGRAINVTGNANQEFWIAGGRIVINEQVSDVDGAYADIAINALRFWLKDCHTGVVGSVFAGVTARPNDNPPPPPPPEPGDCGKVTGGGWIIGTPSGEKGTFGVSGGIRRGEFWGHLTYQDHGTGMHVQSTAVTNFLEDASDENARIIHYSVTIDGAPGTAVVRVVDNGEPGRHDIFEIQLSNGYQAGRELGGARPGGGNIQLHKCPPGWE